MAAVLTPTTPTTPDFYALTVQSTPSKSMSIIHTPQTISEERPLSPVPFPTPIRTDVLSTDNSSLPTVTLTPPNRNNPHYLTMTLANLPSTLLARGSNNSNPIFARRLEFAYSIAGIFSQREPGATFWTRKSTRGTVKFEKTVTVPRLKAGNAPEEWGGEMDVRLYAWRGERLVEKWFVGEYVQFERRGVEAEGKL